MADEQITGEDAVARDRVERLARKHAALARFPRAQDLERYVRESSLVMVAVDRRERRAMLFAGLRLLWWGIVGAPKAEWFGVPWHVTVNDYWLTR